jgi:hypothetical protein
MQLCLRANGVFSTAMLPNVFVVILFEQKFDLYSNLKSLKNQDNVLNFILFLNKSNIKIIFQVKKQNNSTYMQLEIQVIELSHLATRFCR